MALGQAFVEVHADLTPFRRDLNRELRRITTEFEMELNRVLSISLQRTAGEAGTQAGQRFSENFSRHTRDKLGSKEASPWVALTGALAAALDDGISALPAELKAALIVGLIGISPLVGGALAGAISAGIGLAFVGIGVGLASQFQAVQTRWQSFVSNMRVLLVGTAGGFQDALLRVFDLIEVRFAELAPGLTRIFDTAATFLEPFVSQLIDAIDVFLFYMEGVIGETGGFVEELGRGIAMLADALGYAFMLLVSTGEDGQKALRDLLAIVAMLIIGFAQMLVILTKVYGFIRDFASFIAEMPLLLQVLLPPLAIFGQVAKQIDEVSGANEAYFSTNLNVVDSQGRVITRTKEEEKALQDLQKALKGAADATLNAITSNVDYEESLDQLQETLQENGRNINIDTENGRENVRAFATAIEDLRTQLQARVATGELTTQQAIAQYNREIERIEALGNSAGITDQKFYELYGTSIALGELEIAPETAGIDAATASTETLIARVKELIELARHLSSTTILGAVAGARRGLAHGGFAFHRETVDIAEEGPEVVIPLTKPARAAQLMRQAGLDRMGSGETQVFVYIDGQQIEGRMVRVAQRVSSQQGLALAQGFRGL